MTLLSRDQIEMRLIKRVENFEHGYRQNVALLGRAGVGKTKLVSKIFNHASTRSALLPVLISIGDVAPSHLFSYWIGCLFSRALNLPEASLESLMESSEAFLPKTTKAARHILKLQKQGSVALAIRELFALGGQLAEETGRKIVFFLDELLALEKFPVQDVYSIFGNRLMMEKEVLFIVTSSEPRRARKIFLEKLSLLFSNFESIDVQPLALSEMNNLLDRRVCGSYLSLPARRFLYRITDGEPRYLDSLLRVLDESVCSDPRRQIGAAVLFEAVIREVLEVDGRISLEFQKRISSFRRSHRERESLVAETCAVFSCGRLRASHLASALDLKPLEAKKIIMRMEAEDWLVSGGTSFTLRDFLFRFWSNEYLLPASSGQMGDEKIRRSRWTRRLGQIYEMGYESDSGKVTGRLETMLKLFRSEALVLDGRRIAGAHFNEITVSTLSEGRWLMRAKATKETRFFSIAVTELNDQDVELFLTSTCGQKKPIRRVLVALGGIEQNARLLAQQSRIEIWDSRFLNQLLDFFNLPKLIIEKARPAWDDDSSWAGTTSLFSSVVG